MIDRAVVLFMSHLGCNSRAKTPVFAPTNSPDVLLCISIGVFDNLGHFSAAEEIQRPSSVQGMPLRKEMQQHSPVVIASEDLQDLGDAFQRLAVLKLPNREESSVRFSATD